MGLSSPLGGLGASVTLMAFIWLYNHLDGGGADPWQRNARTRRAWHALAGVLSQYSLAPTSRMLWSRHYPCDFPGIR
ncbi:hypothetical protein VMCG_05517 [Cytospora schulzeri]|uniref:Uncharacterized protein n=1 Tax=Cytospora schulzeri TaxID=448051 RepID=A0A423WF79_9PEZI|nr:hypothetical protein VMCG_05517 [Valsa malicola]